MRDCVNLRSTLPRASTKAGRGGTTSFGSIPDKEITENQTGGVSFALPELEGALDPSPFLQNAQNFLESVGVSTVVAGVISAFANGTPISDAELGVISPIRGTNNIVSVAYEPDPVIYFDLQLVNTLDGPARFLWDFEQELLGLEQFGDAQFEATLQAIDNNGDGATATASGFLVTLQESDVNPGSDLNNVIPLGAGGFGSYTLVADDQNPDSFSNMLSNTPFASFGNANPVDGQAMNIEVTLSPGDSALMSGFFSVGDTNNPLPTDQKVDAILGALNTFNNELRLAVPEPASGGTLGVIGGFLLLRAVRRIDTKQRMTVSGKLASS